MTKSLAKGEKKLFIGLWLVIAVIVTLWKFWPTATRRQAELPKAVVARELATIVSHATVVASSTSDFSLKLSLVPEYTAKLSGEKRRLWLRYRFMKDERPLFDGEVETVLDPSENQTSLMLPNPLQARPTHIFVLTQ